MAQRSIFDLFQQQEMDRALQTGANQSMAQAMPVGLGLVPSPQERRDLWQYGEQRELQAETDRPRLTQFLEKDPNWRYGSISPQATREVDGKTERSWAIPDIVRDPIRGFMGLLDQTGEALQGRQVDSAQVGTDLFNVGVGVHLQTGLAKLAAGKMPFELTPEELAAINSWHGTGQDYAPVPKNALGRFDWSKIGTGEGAQAFSYGHYTTGHAGIGRKYLEQDRARKYRDLGIDPNKNTNPTQHLTPFNMRQRLGSRNDARNFIAQSLSPEDEKMLAKMDAIVSPYFYDENTGRLFATPDEPKSVVELMQRGISQYHGLFYKYTPEELKEATKGVGLRSDLAREHGAKTKAYQNALDVLFDEKHTLYAPGAAAIRKAAKMFGKDSDMLNYLSSNIGSSPSPKKVLEEIHSARRYLEDTLRRDEQNMVRFPGDADYYRPRIESQKENLKSVDEYIAAVEKDGLDFVYPDMDVLAESVDISPGGPGQKIVRDEIIEGLQRKRNRVLIDNAALQDQIQNIESMDQAGNAMALDALKKILVKGEKEVARFDDDITQVRKAKVQFESPQKHAEDWASRHMAEIPFTLEDRPGYPNYGQINPDFNFISNDLISQPSSRVVRFAKDSLNNPDLSPKMKDLLREFIAEADYQVGALDTLSGLAKDPARNLYGVPSGFDFGAKDAKDKFIEHVRKSVPKMVTAAAEPEDLADAKAQAERFIKTIKNTDFAAEPVDNKIGGLLEVELSPDLEDYFLYDRPIGDSEHGISHSTMMGLLDAYDASGALDMYAGDMFNSMLRSGNPDYQDYFGFNNFGEFKLSEDYPNFLIEEVMPWLQQKKGSEIYHDIANALDRKRNSGGTSKQLQIEASKLLRKHNVPGTRFYHWEARHRTGGIKNPTENDFNYVTYGDEWLDILAKHKTDDEVKRAVDAWYKKNKNQP